jgi:hypothetical protein
MPSRRVIRARDLPQHTYMLVVGLMGARDGDLLVFDEEARTLHLLRPATPIIADTVIPYLPQPLGGEPDPGPAPEPEIPSQHRPKLRLVGAPPRERKQA